MMFLNKNQIVEAIISINRSATVDFLMSFELTDLRQYLEHLEVSFQPRSAKNPWVRPNGSQPAATMRTA